VIEMEAKEENDKRFRNLIERISNDNWEANLDNFFAYMKGNEMLKVSDELIRKRYKLD
jgi:hypothetical protein